MVDVTRWVVDVGVGSVVEVVDGAVAAVGALVNSLATGSSDKQPATTRTRDIQIEDFFI